MRADTVDAWLHNRFHACIDILLESFPSALWLTIGDGHFGNDARYIQKKGCKALPTDIADTLLKVAVDKGYINEYRVENAEKLSFDADSFDFVLCKTSFHHFPRPMVAFYEMLRVARIGIVLIEPHEAPCFGAPGFVVKRLIKWLMLRFGLRRFLRTEDTSLLRGYQDMWEECGNYVYLINEREIEKAAWACGCAACAFKGFNDHYQKGVEFEIAQEGNEVFEKTRREVAKADRLARSGLNIKPYGILSACVFKDVADELIIQKIKQSGYEWKNNPHSACEKDMPCAEGGI